jgi:tetratricopeptide (TPR) repeat protein
LIRSASRLALLLVLASGSALAKPTAEATRQAKAHFKVAEAAYHAGEYAKAVDEYLAAHQAAPLPGFLFNAAQAYRQAGDVPHAIEYYRRYLEEEPDAGPSDEARKHILALTKTLPPPSPSPEPVVTTTTTPPPPRPAMDAEEVRRLLRKQIEDEKQALVDKEQREKRRQDILGGRRTGVNLLGVGAGVLAVGIVVLGVGLRPCASCSDTGFETLVGGVLTGVGVSLVVTGGALYGVFIRKPLP